MNSCLLGSKYREYDVLDILSEVCVFAFPIAHFLCPGLGWGMLWDIISLFTLGIGLVNLLMQRHLTIHGYGLWMIAFFVCCLLSTAISPSFNVLEGALMDQLKLFIYGIFFMLTVSKKKKYIKHCILSIFLVSVAIAVIIISNVDIEAILTVDIKYMSSLRVGLSDIENINVTAFNITVGLAMSSLYITSYVETHEKIKRILIRICQMFILVGMFFTGTRKAILAAAIILSFEFIDIKKIKNIIILAIIFAAAWYMIMNVPLLYRLVGNRIESFVLGQADIADVSRQNLVADAKTVFFNNPLLGVGINGFMYVSEHVVYAHNNLWEVLADFGIIGGISYYSIFVVIMYRLKDTVFGYRQRTAVLGVIIAYISMEFSQVSYLLLTGALFLSIMCVYMDINKKDTLNDFHLK